MSLLALGLAVLVGLPAGAADWQGDDPPFTPGARDPVLDALLQRERERFEAEAKQRTRPEAKEARRQSRHAYRNASAERALQLARRWDGLVGPAVKLLPLRKGERVDRFLGDYAARIVRESDGAVLVAESTQPLSQQAVDGTREATDLSLREADGKYSPRRPVVPVDVGKRYGAGFALPSVGLRVIPVGGASDTTGEVVGGSVFFPNADRDTDVVVRPVPTGVETFAQLRSAESPERFEYQFDLPEGAVLRPAEPSQAGAEIVKDGEVIARVGRATATDSDGLPVEVEQEVSSKSLVVSVRHRNAELRYPLLLDPQITDSYLTDSAWQWARSNPGFAFFQGAAYLGTGAYIRDLTGHNYQGSDQGYWWYRAQGDASLVRAHFATVKQDNPPGTGMCMFVGILGNNGNWQSGSPAINCQDQIYNFSRDICIPGCAPNATSPNGAAIYGLQPLYTRYYRYFMSAMTAATVYIRDDKVPTLSPTVPTGWIADPNAAITVRASDSGLGVRQASLKYGTTTLDSKNGSCVRSVRCGGSLTLSTTADQLPEGVSNLTASATDPAGNVGSGGPWEVKIDRSAPEVTVSGELVATDGETISEGDYGLRVEATDPYSGVESLDIQVDGESVVDPAELNQPCPDGGCSADREWTFRTSEYQPGQHTITVIARDHAGNQRTESITTVVERHVVAEPSDQYDRLFEGDSPIQTGVVGGAIRPRDISVLRGKVRSRDTGDPLSGVRVSVVDHPEFGETQTQADGEFYLAVNAGQYRVQFEKDGYIDVERKFTAYPRDYAFGEDVAMVQRDSKITQVTFGDGATDAQVHQASTVTDGDGTRAIALIFQPGTEATMRLPDGSSQPLSAGTVRATEFTVGELGEAAMPAELPPTVAYTFAADLSIDEAEAAGARRVDFSVPVAGYLENFLEIPVGKVVPSGTYDRELGAWVADPNGRVVKVVAENGGVAELDIDGSGQAASQAELDALGVTQAELRRVAELYDPGDELWRVPVAHFSWPDWNYPAPATDPAAGPPRGALLPEVGDCASVVEGSIIGCEDQTLGEVFPITGAPFALHYQSERMPGRTAEMTLEIPLSGATLPGPVQRIELDIQIAGRRWQLTRPPEPNQTYTFTWDGLDVFGQHPESAPITVRVGYVYDGRYRGTSEFGQPPGSTELSETFSPTRRQQVFWQVFRRTLGRASARDAGLGGMTLSVHHSYDPVTRTIYFGYGGRRSADSVVESISNYAGTGALPSQNNPNGDGGLATEARTTGEKVRYALDGSLYIAEWNDYRVRRVRPDGVIETVAGTGVAGGAGDGGPATAAQLDLPLDVDLGPDGSLYIAEGTGRRIRRVRPDGTIETLMSTALDPVALAVAPDGTVYYAANGRNYAGVLNYSMVGRITPDGEHRYVVPPALMSSDGDGGPASDATVHNVQGLDLGPDGSVYVAERRTDYAGRSVVRRIRPDGIIERVAGAGTSGQSGDGEQALEAQIAPTDVAVGPDGSLLISTDWQGEGRVRRVATDGTIDTVAGGGSATAPGYGDGGPARRASLRPTSVDVAPDGTLYIGDGRHYRVRRVSRPLPGYTDGELVIPSADGSELYIFDRDGRHLETKNALTGATLWSFTYVDGRLARVIDGDGNETEIERRPDGRATAIVAPDGERTTLTTTARGFLGSITDPAGGSFTLTYSSNGLLQELRDPEGNQATFDYDAQGRLIRDEDAAGGQQTLERVKTEDGFRVTHRTERGVTTRYEISASAEGTTTHKVVRPDGHAITTARRFDGTAEQTRPDGTTVETTQAGDPRYGTLAPYTSAISSVTPGGLSPRITTSRTATGTDPDDPLALGTLAESRTADGKTETTVFDRALSQLTFTSPSGRSSSTTIDSQGRPLTVTVPSIAPVSYAYDSRGRLLSVTQGQRSLIYAYDTNGNVESVTDSTGRRIRFTYDAANRVTATELSDGRVVSFTYDRNGDLTSVTPPSRPAHYLGRTPLRSLARYTAPDAGQGSDQTSYIYNDDRQLAKVTRPDGQELTFGYDSSGRLDTVTEPDGGTMALSYDAQTGRLEQVTTADGVTSELAFDGPLPTGTELKGPVVGRVSQSFDDQWRLDSTTVSGGHSVTYAYDHDDLLTLAGDLQLMRRPDNGLLVGSVLDSVATDYQYDTYADLESHEATFEQQVLFSQWFQRDNAGRITSKTEITPTGSHTYTYRYDDAGRLEEVSRDGGVEVVTYEYDGNSNRISVTRGSATTFATYDTQDRLSSYGGAQYEYTRAGELRLKTDGQGTTRYEYDVLGNLDRVELPDGRVIEYLWDGFGRRVGRKVDGQLTHGWLWGEWDGPVAELDAQGNVKSHFVYATRSNVPDYMVRDGNTYRIITDHLGSPRVVVDAATGVVVQEIEYDEFGRVLRDTNPGFQPFGFAGGLYDEGIGLVRLGARDYDPETGRWTSKDPLLFAAGDPNLYGYVLADPVNLVDPSGYLAVRLGWPPISVSANDIENVRNASAGLGDAIVGPIGPWGRQLLGADPIDECSSAYRIGNFGGTVAGTMGPGQGVRLLGVRVFGRNPRVTKRGIISELPGGRPTAKSIFRNRTKGRPIEEDETKAGDGLRRYTPDNKWQIRMHYDGRTRIEIKHPGDIHESVHFLP